MRNKKGPIAIASYVEVGHRLDDDRLLIAELQKQGVDAHLIPWNDPQTQWEKYKAIVVRSTWDYCQNLDSFQRWLEMIETLPAKVQNSPQLMRWNLNKRYLADLRSRGVDLPQTLFPGEFTPASISGLGHHPQIIVKKLIGAGAWGIRLLKKEDLIQELEVTSLDGYFVQEFLPEIQTHGEVSLIFIQGQFYGATHKLPKAGDFRVQERHGGTFTFLSDVPQELVAHGIGILKTLPEVPLYARVDGVLRGDRFLLMELELVEPELFLRMDSRLLQAMVNAVTIL